MTLDTEGVLGSHVKGGSDDGVKLSTPGCALLAAILGFPKVGRCAHVRERAFVRRVHCTCAGAHVSVCTGMCMKVCVCVCLCVCVCVCVCVRARALFRSLLSMRMRMGTSLCKCTRVHVSVKCWQKSPLHNNTFYGKPPSIHPLAVPPVPTPQNASRDFAASVAALSPADAARCASDSAGSRVLEALLMGPASTETKKQLLGSLEESWGKVAGKAPGSFLVERAYAWGVSGGSPLGGAWR